MSDTDHVLTFLLAGRVFYLHGCTYGILEVQHGGTMSVVSLARAGSPERRQRFVPVEGAGGIPVFKSLSTDNLAGRTSATVRIDADDSESPEIEMRIPRRELDEYQQQLKYSH